MHNLNCSQNWIFNIFSELLLIIFTPLTASNQWWDLLLLVVPLNTARWAERRPNRCQAPATSQSGFILVTTKLIIHQTWLLGVCLPDHVSNHTVQKKMGSVPISKKMHEKRLQWYGHVLQASLHIFAYITFHFNIHGRPKQGWQDTINVGMKNAHLDQGAVFDHARWSLLNWEADPAPEEKNARMIMMMTDSTQSWTNPGGFNAPWIVSYSCF